MPTYQTRHLEAQADFSHGDLHLRKGDRFEASEIDADYYIEKKRATEVQPEPVPLVPRKTLRARTETTPVQPAKPPDDGPPKFITAADLGVPTGNPAGI